MFINADVVARAYNAERPGAVALEAGKHVLRMLDEALTGRESFCYETTLSSHQSLRILSRARLSGYQVGLIFVALQNSDLHVQRVRDRVFKGGHSIPEAIVRRRFDLSFANLARAIPLCNSTTIFDNSNSSGPRLVLQIENLSVSLNLLKAENTFDQRIGAIAGGALGTGVRLSL